MEIRIRDSLCDPDAPGESKIFYRRAGTRTLYRVFIYLEGPELPFVESVTYTLHPTFDEPVRTVRRTPQNPLCKLEIWTWGLFEVLGVVADRRGSRYTLKHQLQYGKEIDRSKAEAFVEV